ncbi:MAG TPA: RNA polymerase sigma factor RpoE [Bacteroidetes bacterium]|nr:RNA polymerase sigma factor RpoE [Bacteroidota bacterium]
MVVLDDAVLVQRFLRGDQGAFEALLDRYQKPIFNAALRITNNSDDAADITQVVFIKAYEKLQSYNSKYKFFSWLYRIAINESLNYLQGRRQLEQIDDELPSSDQTPEQSIDREEIQEQIEAALLELSLDYRIAIVLCHLQGLSYREAGYVLDVPEKTVKSRLFTARKLMKDILLRKGIMK